jgi:hypothetical protein
MWIFLPCGFYSIVEKKKGDLLTVRARAAADLDRLRERSLPTLSPTQAGGGTDYPYRATASRAEVAAALAQAVQTLDYSNFKSQVQREHGRERAGLYHQVWEVMRGAERLERSGPRGGRGGEER